MASVGVVIIGRNEGDRLRQCLEAVTAQVDCAVYVDSGSTDGSPELAKSMEVETVVPKSGPHTAARGRQLGLETLLNRGPELQYVQFLDGDCVMSRSWLPEAIAYLEANPSVGGVSGRRREERCGEGLFSDLLDIDWDQPAGDAPHVGGDSLMRVSAVMEVGGWTTELIAGEDPDISFRMRDAGWSIVRLEGPMTAHDAGMTRFGQYWTRAVRSGHAYAEVGWKHRNGPGRPWLTRTLGIIAYGAVLPIVGIASILVYWPLAVLVGLAYGRLAAVMVRSCRRKGRSWRVSLVYALLNTVCKVANLAGVFQYCAERASGRTVRLIEYKGRSHPSATLEKKLSS